MLPASDVFERGRLNSKPTQILVLAMRSVILTRFAGEDEQSCDPIQAPE
jgi:hypothetical protein